MGQTLRLRCACGQVTGQVRDASPRRGSRLVCMCDDCQTFAHHLGGAATILDSCGGTEVYQTTPSRLELLGGLEHLACLRLSPKGLLRWYASCCGTPIANNLNKPKLPFVGIVHTFFESDEPTRDEQLGPIRCRVNGRFGHPPMLPNSYQRAPLGLLLRTAGLLLRDRLKGEQQPSPFFTESDALVVEPIIVSLEDRKHAHARASSPPHAS